MQLSGNDSCESKSLGKHLVAYIRFSIKKKKINLDLKFNSTNNNEIKIKFVTFFLFCSDNKLRFIIYVVYCNFPNN